MQPLLDRRSVLGGIAAGAALLGASRVGATEEIDVATNLSVAMRDGTLLRADLYRPAGPGPFPTLIQRTPYNKDMFAGLGRIFAARGFLTVIQDMRGQFASEGRFLPWVHEGDDGYDSIEWAARLPQSNGRVGTFGASYSGFCQWQAALRRPPHLAAMAVQVAPADLYEQWVYPGGAFALSFNETWLLHNVAASAAARLPDGKAIQAGMARDYAALRDHWYDHLPLDDFPPLLPDRPELTGYYFDWLKHHPTRDDYWQALSLRGRHGRISVPVLNFAGWYDVFLAGTIENYQAMRDHGGSRVARRNSSLVIGPWAHLNWGTRLGDVDFGAAAVSPFVDMTAAWFDRWLRNHGNAGPADEAPIHYFMMGENRWRTASNWPPGPPRPVPYHLASGGRANSLAGDGRLDTAPPAPRSKPDRFVYDPATPVPSIGGHSCCYGPESPMGPYDQRPVESRSDVLVYTSDALPAELAIAGPVTVELWAATSAPDTDFTAKLVAVEPDGRAINLSDGIIRARYRNGFEHPEPVQPGTAHRYRITLNPTAHLFKAGHRIRVEISSSNFPTYDRNPNSGDPIGRSIRMMPAQQVVFHDESHPSALILPVQVH
ncbi:hypothetical protein SAMN06295920_10396 [Rhizorhabdus histidinilytica]|uniref:Xaa-Pro dipeptidyl-peptidase C-terminal domain-containing protein n=2 Tax=Rhizorhabdus histidinilytica TaxID=439228 RepID=A0A1T5BL47_9SPHN|nr:hypothetical protein SAMN06295920_10396 [Rhizorhabdus histidinilytica]